MEEKIILKPQYMNCYDELEIMNSIDYSIKKSNTLYEVFIRIFDVIGAILGCIIGIPIMIVFGIFIKLEDGGPIVYKQERVGQYGKPFILYKLRSMRVDAEKYRIQWTDKDDNRILKIGKLIRKTRIDEMKKDRVKNEYSSNYNKRSRGKFNL